MPTQPLVPVKMAWSILIVLPSDVCGDASRKNDALSPLVTGPVAAAVVVAPAAVVVVVVSVLLLLLHALIPRASTARRHIASADFLVKGCFLPSVGSAVRANVGAPCV